MSETNGESRVCILVVDDDPAARVLLAGHLQRAGHEVLTADNSAEALRIIGERGPRMVITDWMMPEMDGLDLCRAIRSHEGIPFTFVIIVTAQSDEECLVRAFEAGADDYLAKPFNRRELLARIRGGERIIKLQQDLDRRSRDVHLINAEMAVAHTKLAEANEMLNLMATTDELTGLTNRREALARLNDYWTSGERHGHPLACIALDIDHFKSFNDVHGHAIGDLVLKETAKTMRATARKDERVCRVGGEEFLVLCPHSTEAAAAVGAERIRKVVESGVITSGELALKLTISLGVAERTAEMAVQDDLLRAADDALYAAKRAGRNRVCLASETPQSVSSDNPAEEADAGAEATACVAGRAGEGESQSPS